MQDIDEFNALNTAIREARNLHRKCKCRKWSVYCPNCEKVNACVKILQEAWDKKSTKIKEAVET